MTDKNKWLGADIEALEQALDRFGSDRTRWPAPVRRDCAGLLATNVEAQAMLREAEALDRLLDLAPQPDIDVRALSSRILVAASSETPLVHSELPRARYASLALSKSLTAEPHRASPPAIEARWPAAALLAASLVLGGFFGLSGSLDSTVAPLLADAGYEQDVDAGQIALDSDSNGLFGEDYL